MGAFSVSAAGCFVVAVVVALAVAVAVVLLGVAVALPVTASVLVESHKPHFLCFTPAAASST